MGQKVRIKITASVETTVELEEGETVDNVQDRCVDIYLHGAGDKGYHNKVDLGCTFDKIEVLDQNV